MRPHVDTLWYLVSTTAWPVATTAAPNTPPPPIHTCYSSSTSQCFATPGLQSLCQHPNQPTIHIRPSKGPILCPASSS
jgi:hypothetical protein